MNSLSFWEDIAKRPLPTNQWNKNNQKISSCVSNREENELASFIEKAKTTSKELVNGRFVTPATVFKGERKIKFSVKILERFNFANPLLSRMY